MSLTDLAIKFRTTVAVLTLMLLMGGAAAYVGLPKESSPSIQIPIIVVTTVYSGASPSDIETLITQKVEQELQGIEGIKKIDSISSENASTIIVEFNPDVNIDTATQKVRDKVDLAKPELPTDADEPIISEINSSDFPIMAINLAADYPLSRLQTLAEDLQDRIELIPSVLEAELQGGLEREVQVDVDLAKMQGYNLQFHDISQAIASENANIPGGSVDIGEQNYLIRADGQFHDPREMEKLVLKAPNGKPVYLRDVAEVRLGFKDRSSISRLRVLRVEAPDGEFTRVPDLGYRNVISLIIKKRSGKNILETSDAIQKELEAFDFPEGTQVIITGDMSRFVRDLVKDLENNIISGLLFVVAVLLFFLGVRNSLIVGVAIPLSMMASFLTLQIMGETLNFITLYSLIIALGMLVDNAIVIVENIYRFMEEGKERWEAAKEGTREVALAVAASTATTVAAFVPMLFWPGVMGRFMSFLPMTLIITLSCSLFVAIVINPVVTGFFAQLEDDSAPKTVWPLFPKLLGGVLLAITLALIAVTNLKTFIVVVGLGIFLYAVHMLVMRHIADAFSKRLLPRAVIGYRDFLELMLTRNYQSRGDYLKNAFGLGSLALGLVLAVGGLFAFWVFGKTAAMLLLAPAAVFGAIGLLMVVLHTLETLLIGRYRGFWLGLGFFVLEALFLLSLTLGGVPLQASTQLALLSPPVLVALLGLLGGLILKPGATLILTDNRARLLNTVLGTLLTIIGLFVVAPTGVAFFPKTDPNQARITAEGPLGSPIEVTDAMAHELQDRVELLLKKDATAEHSFENMLVNVGAGTSFFGGTQGSPSSAMITVNFIKFGDRQERSSVTLQKLREAMGQIAGVHFKFEQDEQGPPTGAPVNIEIAGPDFHEVVRYAQQIKNKLEELSTRGEVPGLVDIDDNMDEGRREVQIRVNRERAAQFGLSTQAVALMVRTAMNGIEVSKFRDGEDEYEITLRLREADRSTLESLQKLTVFHEGRQIPLVAVADFSMGTGLGSVIRKDLRRLVTVFAEVEEGYNAQETLGRVKQSLSELKESLPTGYTMAYTGENEEQDEAFGFLTKALAVGVAMILMILIAQFNSVSGPLLIMGAVAMSMIGVLLGLLVTRTPFSLFTFIGVISLAGIVVNNNIVLIDYTEQLRGMGRSKRDALVEAGSTRLRPVLLTALTTVLGLIPLTFGINVDFLGLLTDMDPNFQLGSENTQFWGPMGVAIISGLSFATFLTLVIVPVSYSLLDSLTERFEAAVQPKLVETETTEKPE